jgi:uncharacterized integral membrane protein
MVCPQRHHRKIMPLLFCTAPGAVAGLPPGRAVFPAAPVSGRVQSVISSSLMRYLLWLLKFVLFVLILSFAIKNTDTVTVRYYLGYEWQAPLVLVLLVFFGLGRCSGSAGKSWHCGASVARNSAAARRQPRRILRTRHDAARIFGRLAWTLNTGGCSPCRCFSVWAGWRRA